MNLSGILSDSLALVVQLVKDIEGKASAGASLEAVLADPQVMQSLSALVKDIIG